MSRLEHIVEQRLEKLRNLQSQGINPSPNRYHRSHTIKEAVACFLEHEAQTAATGLKFSLAGRLVASRGMGKIAFSDLRDGSGKIQLFFSRELLGDEKYQFFKDLDIGDIIGASGILFRTKTDEITLQVSEFDLLSKALHPLPEKWHGLVDVEKRFRHRYLDLISNEETQSVFVRRSRVIQYFDLES